MNFIYKCPKCDYSVIVAEGDLVPYCKNCGKKMYQLCGTKSAAEKPYENEIDSNINSGDRKSKTTALLLAILAGGLGIDRFYLGYTGLGVLKLFTAGCFGILWIIDIVMIATGDLTPADGSAYSDDMKSTPITTQPQKSDADELKKYKELLDMGAITQEEYDAKKKRILGL